jgi:hypothetical protein
LLLVRGARKGDERGGRWPARQRRSGGRRELTVRVRRAERGGHARLEEDKGRKESTAGWRTRWEGDDGREGEIRERGRFI